MTTSVFGAVVVIPLFSAAIFVFGYWLGFMHGRDKGESDEFWRTRDRGEGT